MHLASPLFTYPQFISPYLYLLLIHFTNPYLPSIHLTYLTLFSLHFILLFPILPLNSSYQSLFTLTSSYLPLLPLNSSYFPSLHLTYPYLHSLHLTYPYFPSIHLTSLCFILPLISIFSSFPLEAPSYPVCIDVSNEVQGVPGNMTVGDIV